MVVQDLWLLKKKDPKTRKRLRSKRHGVGQRWRVSVPDPDSPGKYITEHFDDEKEANARNNVLLAELSKGTFVDPRKARKTVADFGEEWLGQLVMRRSSLDATRRRFRLHVEPVIGHLSIGRVRSGSIQGWVRNRKDKGLAASTIRVIFYGVLYPMFQRAVMDDVIGKNPCNGDIQLPELPDGTYDLPTAEQVHAVTQKLPERFRAVPMLAAGCGWRYAEIFGLEKGSIDFLRSEASVVQQIAEFKGEGMGLSPPKSRLSRRINEVPEVTKLALARHLELFPPVPVPVLDRTDPDNDVERTAELVFTDHKGRPMRRGQWSRIWPAAMEAAGLAPWAFSLHSLRHFFATTLIFDGVNVKAVQLACGHANPTITMNTYLGYWPGDERLSTRRLLDKALSAPIRTESVPKIVT